MSNQPPTNEPWQPQPQPQYQPYPPPPPMQQPPPKKPSFWKRKIAGIPMWLFVSIVVVAIVFVVNAAATSTPSQNASTNAQPTPTSAPTQAVAANTPAPTAKPQPSIQSQLQSIAQGSGATYGGGATVTYDADFKYAHVFESFPVTGDRGLDVSRIKHDSYAIQKAIWQAHVSGVDAVQVLFNSDDATPLRIATCEVERTTATKLKWASITSDQAWSDYDQTWLSPGLT